MRSLLLSVIIDISFAILSKSFFGVVVGLFFQACLSILKQNCDFLETGVNPTKLHFKHFPMVAVKLSHLIHKKITRYKTAKLNSHKQKNVFLM